MIFRVSLRAPRVASLSLGGLGSARVALQERPLGWLVTCGWTDGMGFFQRLFGALGMTSKACKILVVGLDDAGKTTIMNQIMPKKVRANWTCSSARGTCDGILSEVDRGRPRSVALPLVRAAPVQRGGANGGVQDRAVREEQHILHDV